MRILVVDDEPLVARTVSLVLRKNGFEVETVYTASDALASARQIAPDLVLCDINMPVRDGIELIHDLGRELPACPVLVLTGSYPNLTRIEDNAPTFQQIVRVLTKPCPPLTLVREAGDLLNHA